MAKGNYDEGEDAAAGAILDAIAAKDRSALSAALKDHYALCAPGAGDVEEPDDVEESDGSMKSKGPSIALILAKHSAKKAG